MLKSLYNTDIAERRAIGYCHRHHCYVTSKQIKQKQCLSKQCNHLEKQEHEFWKQRELTKLRRKNRKELFTSQIKMI